MLTEAQMCLRVDVQRALRQFSEAQRQALMLIAVEGMSIRDAAHLMGMDRNTCFRLYRRARRLLRHRLRTVVESAGKKK